MCRTHRSSSSWRPRQGFCGHSLLVPSVIPPPPPLDQPRSVAGDGSGGFEAIGTDGEQELKLADLQSYDEMQLSALLSVSVPTLFMNKGDRDNFGNPGVR